MLTALLIAVLSEYPNGGLQLRLVEDMKATEVLDLLGAPDTTESTMCGTKTKFPWRCRTWSYSGEGHTLMLTFRVESSVWILNDWSSY